MHTVCINPLLAVYDLAGTFLEATVKGVVFECFSINVGMCSGDAETFVV